MQLKELNNAQAAAAKQTELTQTHIEIEISANRGEAQLAEAQRLAKRDVARAFGEVRAKDLLGKGEAARVAQVGLAEASVFLQKIRAYGDPRLFALNLVSDQFSKSVQPLVPQRLLVMGGGEGKERSDIASSSVLGQLLALLLAEKAGVGMGASDAREFEKFADDMTKRFSQSPQEGEVAAAAEQELMNQMNEKPVQSKK